MKLTTLLLSVFLTVTLWQGPAHSLEATGALSLYLASQREQLDPIHFPVSCNTAAQTQFNRAMALLHSFRFAAARRAFTTVTECDPTCAMGHWGEAMSLLDDPFAWPPSAAALAASRAAVEKAKALGVSTRREQAYIAAIEAFTKDAGTVDYRSRALAYEKAMAQLARRFPADPEATIFYAMAVFATALPADQACAKQLKAAALLEQVFATHPQHPGVAYYLRYGHDYVPVPRWEAPRMGSGSSASSAYGPPEPGQAGGWQASAIEHLRLVSALCPALHQER